MFGLYSQAIKDLVSRQVLWPTKNQLGDLYPLCSRQNAMRAQSAPDLVA